MDDDSTAMIEGLLRLARLGPITQQSIDYILAELQRRDEEIADLRLALESLRARCEGQEVSNE